jgi:hypothetical protein
MNDHPPVVSGKRPLLAGIEERERFFKEMLTEQWQ